MKSFDSYLIESKVVRISFDRNLAKSIIEDARQRIAYHIGLELSEINSKYIFENCYEAVRELLDVLLLINGYKSYSHTAPIVFARDKVVITHKEAILLDRIRDKRNKSKYYGKSLDIDYVDKNMIFLNDIFNKLIASFDSSLISP